MKINSIQHYHYFVIGLLVSNIGNEERNLINCFSILRKKFKICKNENVPKQDKVVVFSYFFSLLICLT